MSNETTKRVAALVLWVHYTVSKLLTHSGMNDVNAAIIEGYLKQLRLSGIAQNMFNVAREAEEDGRSYLEFLKVRLEAEITRRRENQARRLTAQATFPLAKGLEGFRFDAVPSLDRQKVLNLALEEFVESRRNAILIGNSGTGKTHLAMGLGQELCRRGYKVRFYTASGLVNERLAVAVVHFWLDIYSQAKRREDFG